MTQAIARAGPSAPLKALVLPLVSAAALGGDAWRVLDFGSGRGADVRFLRGLGLDAQGYDPEHGPRRLPPGPFELVTAIYVLNVVPRADRRAVVAELARRVGRGGLALLVTRPRVAELARRHGWPQVEPGGWLSKAGSYQGEVSADELRALLQGAGLRPEPLAVPAGLVGVLARR